MTDEGARTDAHIHTYKTLARKQEGAGSWLTECICV